MAKQPEDGTFRLGGWALFCSLSLQHCFFETEVSASFLCHSRPGRRCAQSPATVRAREYSVVVQSSKPKASADSWHAKSAGLASTPVSPLPHQAWKRRSDGETLLPQLFQPPPAGVPSWTCSQGPRRISWTLITGRMMMLSLTSSF